MSEYNQDEYLMLSGIQHFVFCRRQWALIHIEQQWAENFRTVDGNIMHEKAHNSSFNEKRGDTIITRGMAISSAELGVSGECDVVEFHKSNKGTEIFGYEGRYEVVPIEYKRGEPKENESDVMQLCAQAMCLEEMLCCEINEGFLFYGENKRRHRVLFDGGLRERTKAAITEMHRLYAKKYTPKVKRTKSCNACSLKEICLPVLMKNKSASEYIRKSIEDAGGD
ncbi:MAG: CRISPR-associated protein Cas4 [Hominimerdicola sp.]